MGGFAVIVGEWGTVAGIKSWKFPGVLEIVGKAGGQIGVISDILHFYPPGFVRFLESAAGQRGECGGLRDTGRYAPCFWHLHGKPTILL